MHHQAEPYEVRNKRKLVTGELTIPHQFSQRENGFYRCAVCGQEWATPVGSECPGVPVYPYSGAPDHLQTLGQLHNAGLQPAEGQQPAGAVRGKKYYFLYDARQAIARPRPSPARIAALERARAAQLKARTCTRCGRVEAKKLYDGLCPDCREEEQLAQMHSKEREQAIAWARAMLADGAVILDVESTGMDSGAEVCQIGIIDLNGQTLMDTLVKATVDIDPEARRVHGISAEMLLDAPAFDALHAQLSALLDDRTVIAYNSAFDSRMLAQTCRRYGAPRFRAHWKCAMEAYAAYFGDWSQYHRSYRWQTLEAACWQMQVVIDTPAHTAVGDCLRTLGVIRAMADGD